MPPGRQRAHQHLPAVAGAFLAADQRVQRHEHVTAAIGAVLEGLHGGQMAPADLHARRIDRHQRHRDADVARLAQDAVGIGQLEGQPQHRGHRPQRDVALVPVQPDADQLAPVHHLAADHAGVGHGGRVRAGLGAGQAEAGNLAPVGQARQPVVALRRRAELHQQLARSERVGHHHGDAGGDRVGGDAAHHLGMRVRREAQATVAARDDHAEALRLQEGPDLGRQVAAVPADIPFVQHGAQLRHGPVDELPLVRRQRGGRHVQQLAPVRIAAEEIGLPPGVAGLDGLAFGRGHGRQRAPRPTVGRFGNAAPAPGVEIHGLPFCCRRPRAVGPGTHRVKVPELRTRDHAGPPDSATMPGRPAAPGARAQAGPTPRGPFFVPSGPRHAEQTLAEFRRRGSRVLPLARHRRRRGLPRHDRQPVRHGPRVG